MSSMVCLLICLWLRLARRAEVSEAGGGLLELPDLLLRQFLQSGDDRWLQVLGPQGGHARGHGGIGPVQAFTYT